MKKHNEGYTLPLVLVVMIVLSLVALGVMSVSLHNLQAQKVSIERMESKYAAQGELEKAIANLSKVLTINQTISANETGKAEVQSLQDAAAGVFLGALGVKNPNSCVILQQEPKQDQEGEFVDKLPVWTENASGAMSCTIFLHATDPKGKTEIICSIYLENVLVPKDGSFVYFYHDTEIIYTSYEIGGVA